jgi:hypothetical protein
MLVGIPQSRIIKIWGRETNTRFGFEFFFFFFNRLVNLSWVNQQEMRT